MKKFIHEYIIKVDESKKDIMGGSPLVEKAKPLVRCKDCRHYDETQRGVPRREPFKRYVCDYFNPADDFFCADGEE